MKMFLSIVAVTKDNNDKNYVYTDIKELVQKDTEAINDEIHDRVGWFINGIAFKAPFTLVSLSHSVFTIA